MKSFRIIPIILFLLSSTSFSNELEKKGDELYKGRKDIAKAKEALNAYEEASKSDVKNAVLFGKISMTHYFIGHHLSKDENKISIEHFEEGIKAAERCDELAEKKIADCPFWYATNKVLLVQEKGSLSTAFALRDIIKNLKRARDLDASYAGAAPSRLLGILYKKMPGIFGGDKNLALKYFDEALEKAPADALTYMEKGRLLHELSRTDESKKVAEEGLKKCIGTTEDHLESFRAYGDLKVYLEKGIWQD